MHLIDALGYVAAGLIGLTLAILGGGGAILTVPILVFLFSVPSTQAAGYSLGIVGATGLVGAAQAQGKKQVSWEVALLYLPTSMLATWIVRKQLVPSLPANLFSASGHQVSRDNALLIIFGVVMALAARAMLKKKSESVENQGQSKAKIPVLGLAVGSLSGLLGAGGGFLIVPALVLYAGLEMPIAIGTSLSIICINSLFGFSAEVSKGGLDWPLIAGVTAAAVVGMMIGFGIRSKIDTKQLRPAFGWFLVANSVFMLVSSVVKIFF